MPMAFPAQNPLAVFRGVLAAGLVVLVLVANGAQAGRLHRYTVAIDPDLTAIDVRACFDGTPPVSLVAESPDAVLALTDVRIEGSRKPVEPGGRISLRSVPDGGCFRYRTNVSQPIRQHDRTGGKIRRIGADLLTSAGIWFWRPESLSADEDVEITFELPEGISVSAPWVPEPLEPNVYRMGRAAWNWPASVAFGRFREREIRVGGASLRLAVLDGNPPANVEQMQAWIADAAQSVAGLYGRFPQPQAQILVVPGARGNEPTPWAHVVRGGGPAAHFFVNQRRAIQEYFDDWTAVHELSHLLLPYVNLEDAWLSEGVATYYQNVLRARSGRMTVQEAWERLHAGFLRGIDNAPGMTLAQATENMYRGGPYMRVYWEGVAMILLADVRLRQLTAGKQSMDTALAALNDCCSAVDRAWTARDLFDKFDEITGTTVFRDIYDHHVASADFPDLVPAYRALGIVVRDDGIELLPEEREQSLRDAIMGNGAVLMGETREGGQR